MEFMSKFITIDEIDLLRKPLDKLHEYHNNKSTYFPNTYPRVTFEERIEGYKTNAKQGQYRIELLTDDEAIINGFCIAYGKTGSGKIDVLFVDEEHRGKGLGAKLMNNAMEWFAQNDIKEIELTVVYGNTAESFYRNFGFFPRSYIMTKKA